MSTPSDRLFDVSWPTLASAWILLVQGSPKAKTLKHAGVEASDSRDPLARQCEHQQPDAAVNAAMGISDVEADRRLVGTWCVVGDAFAFICDAIGLPL